MRSLLKSILAFFTLGLGTVAWTKEGGTHLGKPVSLAKATFNPATNSVTLVPRTTFPRLALQLDIKATLVRDPWDQPLNGGHDYIATIRPRGAVTAGRSSSATRSRRLGRSGSRYPALFESGYSSG